MEPTKPTAEILIRVTAGDQSFEANRTRIERSPAAIVEAIRAEARIIGAQLFAALRRSGP